MQQSVNGNIKHKTFEKKREGDFAGNKTSTAVSTAIFLMCFSCTVRVGLGSSCKLKKKKKKVLLLAYDKEAVFSANS